MSLLFYSILCAVTCFFFCFFFCFCFPSRYCLLFFQPLFMLINVFVTIVFFFFLDKINQNMYYWNVHIQAHITISHCQKLTMTSCIARLSARLSASLFRSTVPVSVQFLLFMPVIYFRVFFFFFFFFFFFAELQFSFPYISL